MFLHHDLIILSICGINEGEVHLEDYNYYTILILLFDIDANIIYKYLTYINSLTQFSL